MRVVITETAWSVPIGNVDAHHTDPYYYKKLNSTGALFAKIVFYNQNLNLWEKHLQKMAGCNKYTT